MIRILLVLLTVFSNALLLSSVAVAQVGPQPGEVYREYARHNAGQDWRVSDPKVKREDAQKFLPNPVLNLVIDNGGLEDAVRVEALIDRWGGHHGTKDKRIRFNGNDWISVPEIATTPKASIPENYHSQDNPIVAVPLGHLRPGVNTLEGTVADDTGWWGHWGLYSLILRVYYEPDSRKHSTVRIISPSNGETFGENPTIRCGYSIDTSRIDILAWYDGYDEDGDGVFLGWHGSYFQPRRGDPAGLQNHVGTLWRAPYELTWDTRFVPDQKSGEIKLIARVQNTNGTWSVSQPVGNLSLERKGRSVRLFRAEGVPERFSVRIDRTKSCRIPIPESVDLDRVTEVGLHYRTWHGWDGHHAPFRLNGHEHLNEGKNHHYDYDILPIPAGELKAGDNEFTIHSTTEHHYLEVLWPGPALSVRFETDGKSTGAVRGGGR